MLFLSGEIGVCIMGNEDYKIDAIRLCSFGKLSFTFKKGCYIQEYLVEREAIKAAGSPQGFYDAQTLIKQFQSKRIQFLTVALLNFKK